MKTLIIAGALVLAGLVSCGPENKSKVIQFSDGVMEIEHKGTQLVYIDQYANGANITISLPDKSKVVLSLDKKMTELEEIIVIQVVENGPQESMKHIVINNQGEIETSGEPKKGQKEGLNIRSPNKK